MKLDSVRWMLLREALDGALELPIEERAAFVASKCGDDLELRSEVEAMLAIEQRGDDLVSAPNKALFDLASESNQTGLSPGTKIGAFVIENELGSGGMSVVYRATQAKPDRTVALKMLRPSLATQKTLERFQFEAEYLGQLSHPNVAHVYEAGLWREGGTELPWFALEYVAGAESLTAFARSRRLEVEDKLRLFLAVCDAVHHGHQKGIVHRDLKPGNLLVDDRGQVKVIDFGIARLSKNDREADPTLTRQMFGTVAYMAPEQFDGSHGIVDVRSDVYALGVVLFELLADSLPLDLHDTTLAEMLTRVREREPLSLHKVRPSIDRELDWITARCLLKEPERRYGSASELAADVQRYLDQEAVLAGPPSRSYMFRKFVQRNRASVSAASLLMIVLIAWGATGNYLLSKTQKSESAKTIALEEKELALDEKNSALVEKDDALLALNTALDEKSEALDEKQLALSAKNAALAESRLRLASLESIRGFLDDTILSIDPTRHGHDALLVDVLRESARTLAEVEEMEPAVGLELHDSLGRAFFGLGEFSASMNHFEHALTFADSAIGVYADTVERIQMNLAQALLELSRFEDSERVSREVFELRSQRFGASSSEAGMSAVVLAQAILARGASQEAYELLQQFSSDETLPEVGILMDTVGVKLLLAEGRLSEAREVAGYVFEDSVEFYGERHPQTIEATEQLAEVLIAQREFELAREHLETSFKLRNELFGPDSPLTWRSANNLAVVLGYLDMREEQEALLRDCLPRMRSELGELNEDVLNGSNNLASCLSATGRVDEAIAIYLDVLSGTGRKYGHSTVEYVMALNNLAFTYQRNGNLAEAQRYFTEMESLLDGVLPAEHYLAAAFRLNHGRVLVALEQYEEAAPLLELALRGFLAVQGEQGAQVFIVRELLDEATANLKKSE